MIKYTIVFLHGNSSTIDLFKPQIEDKSLAFNKVAIPLPGHDKGASGALKDFSTKQTIHYILNEISKIEGGVFLIGNSLGGHLAIEMAHQIKNLKGLMIFGTPPVSKPLNFEEAFVPVEALQTFLTENPTDDSILEACKVAVYNGAHAPVLASAFKKANPLVRTALAEDLTKGNWQNQKDLFLSLDLPKFIVAGKDDPSVNLNYLKEIQESSKANCTLYEIDHCGHYPSIEQPEMLNKIIKEAAIKVFEDE